MSFVYLYIYPHYFILLIGWIFYFFIMPFVLKYINQKIFFQKLFALKSFLLGYVCGIIAVCLYYVALICAKEDIDTMPLFLLAFISGGGIQIYGILLKFHLCNKKSNIHFKCMQNSIIFILTLLSSGLLLIDIMACSPFAILGTMFKESIANNEIFLR